jgi:hypothetical protein
MKILLSVIISLIMPALAGYWFGVWQHSYAAGFFVYLTLCVIKK